MLTNAPDESTLTLVSTLVNTVLLLVTAVGVVFAARQLRLSGRLAQKDFILEIHENMEKFDDVHTALVRSGDGSYVPESAEAWIRLDRYMGVFEVIQILAVPKILDVETVDRLFGHRLASLTANAAVRERNLGERRHRWSDFIALVGAVEKQPHYTRALADLSRAAPKPQEKPRVPAVHIANLPPAEPVLADAPRPEPASAPRGAPEPQPEAG